MDTLIRYRGFAHCHSKKSYDGQYTYPQLRDIFIKNNLNFVCITEHIEYLDQDKIDAIIIECRQNSDGKFLFIPGIEMDEFVVYFIGIEHASIDFTSSKTIFESLSLVAKLCVFSHPIKAKYKYPQWLIELCDGVEIWNTKHDGVHYPRRQSLNLLNKVKQIKPNAVPIAGMDFHSISDLSPANIQLLKTGELTEDFIINEIKEGRYNICKDKEDIREITFIKRVFLWTRITLMDQAHLFHVFVSKKGFKVPKVIKRIARKLMEGK